jgi:urease accessory protein
MSAAGFLAALQLGDSSLPIGRFVHSHGLESWLAANADAGYDDLAELVETTLVAQVGPLDATAVALAHAAPTPDRLHELDELVTAHKLVPSARAASQSCGRQLARLGGRLTGDDLAGSFCRLVAAESTPGNLAIVEGTLARALRLTEEQATLVELRGVAVGMLSAAIRLGRLSAIEGQLMLRALSPAIERASAEAVMREPGDLRAISPELDIAALTHRRADARTFAT